MCPAGSPLTDTYTGQSYLRGDSWFTNHHKYSVLWEPGEFVRWYLDDEVLFEVDKEALRAQVGTQQPAGSQAWCRVSTCQARADKLTALCDVVAAAFWAVVS